MTRLNRHRRLARAEKWRVNMGLRSLHTSARLWLPYFGKNFSVYSLYSELYTTQTKLPFYIVTSNPQILRGNNKHWEIIRFGHANMGRNRSKINDGLTDSLSRTRITVTMKYHTAKS